jgi:hypothetical protein
MWVTELHEGHPLSAINPSNVTNATKLLSFKPSKRKAIEYTAIDLETLLGEKETVGVGVVL